MQHYTYFLVHLFVLGGPLALSFDKKVAFAKHWRAILPAIAIPAAFFIVLDILYTQWGVWGFTDKYLCGLQLSGLPIEEALFFVTVPYACLFVYACVEAYFPKDYFQSFYKYIAWGIVILNVGLGFVYIEQAYTFVFFMLNALFILCLLYLIPSPYLSRFFLVYLIDLIPFFIVNGFLTGTGLDEPIVWYNNEENMGIRMGTIPFEDIFYGMLLVLMNTAIFEYLRKK